MSEALSPPAAPSVSRRLLLGVFGVVCALLALGYFFFVRPDYTLLYADLKPVDASAILAQLDAKGIPHQLRDGGTTIMVPAAEADGIRLAVAGSEIPMKGSVGFELFNKSDMGLTDFAQKINYQRALQGELTRTIMMMDGIETARVHLAIPERSLFRGIRSAPKAAVEVIPKLGHPLTPVRVAGIQQLVASSVPDLIVNEVAILDAEGRVVSQTQTAFDYATPALEEQSAARNYFAARAKSALSNVLPGLQVAVRVLMTDVEGGLAASDDRDETSRRAGAAPIRNFGLRLTISTAMPLNAEDQSIARAAVAEAVALDEQRGDTLGFDVGPVTESAPPTTPARSISASRAKEADEPLPGAVAKSDWWLVGLGAMLIVVLAIFLNRRRAHLPVDRPTFVTKLRAFLPPEERQEYRG